MYLSFILISLLKEYFQYDINLISTFYYRDSGISTDIDRIEEPASGRGVPITFTVTRHNGVKGVVELSYQVNITSAPSAAPNDDENVKSLADSGYDVDVRRGSVYFLSKEVTQTFIIKVRNLFKFLCEL